MLAAAAAEENTYAKLSGHVAISPFHAGIHPACMDK
jgi:hypothetical protein